MSIEYTIEHGQYVCTLTKKAMFPGDPPTTTRIVAGPEVAICFDKDAETVLKHGEPARVQSYHAVAALGFRECGHSKEADDLICITGAFDLEELNKVVSCTNYIGIFYRKLLAQAEPLTTQV